MPTPAWASLVCVTREEAKSGSDVFQGIKSLGSMAHADDRAKSTDNFKIDFVEQIENCLSWRTCLSSTSLAGLQLTRPTNHIPLFVLKIGLHQGSSTWMFSHSRSNHEICIRVLCRNECGGRL
jgi:hypothetical protein